MIEEISSEKHYYSIGEVAKMFNLSISNIRFWEQEFEILKPKKNKKGDRFFTKQDVDHLKIIYHLLKEKGYTIDGARKKLMQQPDNVSDRIRMIESLKKIKVFLQSLKNNLDKKDPEISTAENISLENDSDGGK
ncbi:MAG: MerR family transcriptional regulator [Chitinophagales bacterium]|jgi:DNA-binding transcriptional MerR regulator|nr:MerR family transcriptional regulator [Chitinophagales bacterium]